MPLGRLRIPEDGLQDHRLHRGRHDATDTAEEAKTLVDRRAEASERLGEAGENDVADRMTIEFGAVEAMLESLCPYASLLGDGDEAPAKITRSRNAERLSEPTARTPVVSHRYDPGHVAGVTTSSAQAGGKPVATAKRNDRWTTGDAAARPPIA